MGIRHDPHEDPDYTTDEVLISTRDGYAEVLFAVELHIQNAVIGYVAHDVTYVEEYPDSPQHDALLVADEHLRRTRVQQSDVISIDSMGSFSDRWYGQELTIYYGSELTPDDQRFEAIRKYVKNDLFTELGGGQARIITPRNRKRFFDVLMVDGDTVHCLDVDLNIGEVETYIDFKGSKVQIEARKMTKYDVDVSGVETTVHFRADASELVLDRLGTILEEKFSVAEEASDGEISDDDAAETEPEPEDEDAAEEGSDGEVPPQSSTREFAGPDDVEGSEVPDVDETPPESV